MPVTVVVMFQPVVATGETYDEAIANAVNEMKIDACDLQDHCFVLDTETEG